MQIRFISTLTTEDEDHLAEMIVDTAKALLSHSPLGYMLRIETTNAKLFEHNKVAPSASVNEMRRPRHQGVHDTESGVPPLQPASAEELLKRKDSKSLKGSVL
jgi:hypothetical protein